MSVDTTAVDAVRRHLDTFKSNGYPPGTGYEDARQAVADYYTSRESSLTVDDIIITNGASEGFNLCVRALTDEGDNILLPSPGFPLYYSMALAKGKLKMIYVIYMTRP